MNLGFFCALFFEASGCCGELFPPCSSLGFTRARILPFLSCSLTEREWISTAGLQGFWSQRGSTGVSWQRDFLSAICNRAATSVIPHPSWGFGFGFQWTVEMGIRAHSCPRRPPPTPREGERSSSFKLVLPDCLFFEFSSESGA